MRWCVPRVSRAGGVLVPRLIRRALSSGRACHAASPGTGALLSRQQYLVDIEGWDYPAARLRPDNPMSELDVANWAAGIAEDGSH